MEFDYKKEFNNMLCGKCYLIDEKDNWYLVYASKSINNNNYIVCSYIDSMGTMMNQYFFTTLEDAKKFFEEK